MAPLLRCCVLILLLFFLTLDPGAAEGNGPRLQRQKREWVVAPRKLKENHDYTGLSSIAKIRSDKEYNHTIFYFLKGAGVDRPPIGRFSVDSKTGFVRVHSVLNREEIDVYHLQGVAKFKNSEFAEININITIVVEDENDCTPVVKLEQVGSVNESSAAGTIVMKVIATDGDQVGTPHTKLFYSLDEATNTDGMFTINSQTGEIMVKQTTLDRESKDSYSLGVKVSDMDGRSGNTGGGVVNIKILDINDNVPTLEKEMYEGSVSENTVNTEVMRISSQDMDMINTENWDAVYEIVSGNEGGYFSISTDAKTNEGVIMVNKALDYEELKALNLGVAVSNKAAYNFGSAHSSGSSVVSKSYPVKINVLNQNEGPRFQPGVKVVTISEDQSSINLKNILTNYAAIDSDSLLTATNVRYAKVRDEGNWLIVDPETADIRLNKLPDRESKFLVNGTYYAEIIAFTDDNPSKTATGTIAIQVEDFNDHCPKLTTTAHTMCLEESVIYATAVDQDDFPNSAPFEFTVNGEKDNDKWTVEPFNATTSILRDNADLWPGVHQVTVEVRDQQGKMCDEVQIIDVTVCRCDEVTKSCGPRRAKDVSLGAGGILLLLLGLLLLLLLPLLLMFCLCGGAPLKGDFIPLPYDNKPQLMAFHTEGQGEDKEVPLLHVPVEVDGGAVNIKNVNHYEAGGYLTNMNEFGGALGGRAGYGSGMNASTLTTDELHRYNSYKYIAGQTEAQHLGAGMRTESSSYGGGAFDGMALSEHFLQEYFTNKSNHATQESQQKDGLLVYDYEGKDSLAGSVGCCSLLENDNDLAFLDDLGSKFKTLAEICQGSTIVTHSAKAVVSSSLPRPVSPVRPSTSSHTHVQTHTESVRDRERVHINTVDTSNVATGSSTIFQEERITERAQVPTVQVQENIMIPSQTMLIQQPSMYYTSAPMYVVESQPQMMLVAGGAQQQGLVQVGGLQGSQGMVLVDRQVGINGGMGQMQVGGLQGSQGMVLVERQVGVNGGMGQVQVGGLQGSQGMVLVDRQVGVDGGMGQVAQGFSQGTISRKVMLVENGSTAGQQGGQFIQMGQGSSAQGLEVRGQGYEMRAPSFTMGSLGSTGLNEDFSGHTQVSMATPKLQGSKKQVVQHKKVTVTERNIESNTRA